MTVREFYLYCCDTGHENAQINIQLFEGDELYHSFYLEDEDIDTYRGDEIIIYA